MLNDLSMLFNDAEEIVSNISVFNTELPTEWLTEAFNLTGHATIRRRKIAPEDVIRLVIGMSLMRSEPIQEVAARLAFKSAQIDNGLLARSSWSNARQRLGAAPVEWLFQRSAAFWDDQEYKDELWNGLRVYSIDGTSLRTEDTPECRAYFGSAHSKGERVSAFPAFRLTCLMNARTQIILNAGLCEFKKGEITIASQLVDNLPNTSVVLMDKLYHSAELLHHIEMLGSDRFWVTPLRTDIKWQRVQGEVESDDMLVERTLNSHTRKRSSTLPKDWQFRLIKYQIDGFEPKLLATSLPREQYSKEDIIALYHERWSIELGYRDIKKTMLKNTMTLRSKKPELVIQELYGMLIAYNLIRHEAALAGKQVKVRGAQISFKTTMRVVIYDYYSMATTNSIHRLPKRLKDLTDTVKDFILPKPDRPNYPRAVKMKKKEFPVKRSQPLKAP
ncbi:IS4 family transposase [Pseudoalteromonas sp. Of7M-16]|uniref:IS4 family transposase n=1 Tax=Pseudoalteromonas sp. Of7M-16 TaxID=2917756 RepID=UPI001EF5D90C|nr:IS4 family transposase [Pseudoalteromonas sp. Of7M-16]MCG7551792.1 IS4 family transposase [Pseudoalteromonas sp. Of7M-16]